MRSYAYEGSTPHGLVLELFETDVKVDGREALTIVKTNYMAEGHDTSAVMDAKRDEFLDSVTVMFKREKGYDPDNQDWFWAKCRPGGEMDVAPNDLPMAGRVQGCINSHGAAPGYDMLFEHNRYSGR